jgi:hypothetical protein
MGYERIVPAFDLDDPVRGEDLHGFADRAPACGQFLREFDFVRKPVASSQLLRDEQVADCGDN